MVVADEEGFDKKSYRLFNFDKDMEKGKNDDFAMMAIMLKRRFEKQILEQDEQQKTHHTFPDLIMLDGGKGQLSVVLKEMQKLGLEDRIPIVAISKGEDRHAGKETIHLRNGQEINLDVDDTRQLFIQRLRDEAHRFAIGAHRKKRSRAIQQNALHDISGIGDKKRKQLMQYFGSVQAVKEAGVKDLMKVEGVSEKIAENIYYHFHESL